MNTDVNKEKNRPHDIVYHDFHCESPELEMRLIGRTGWNNPQNITRQLLTID